MTVPLDNMTEQEIELFARMAKAPLEHRQHFRRALTSLLRCYGEDADAGCTVLYADYKENTLEVNQIGVSLPDSLQHIQAALDSVSTMIGATPRPDDATVQ